MFDLFNQPSISQENSVQILPDGISRIPGLQYIPNFISQNDEFELLQSINQEVWLSDIKRRVQHYGYRYDYKARSIDYSMYLGRLPAWVMKISDAICKGGQMEQAPNQMIINEYLPGQGITNHVDCEPCFGETIISLSLSSPCIMDFVNVKTKQKIELLLEKRSLVVINGEARHKWSHGIAPRKTDFFNNLRIERGLRISITFRNVILR
jgi:alkylated DNA repair dioxygenase AlkB